ncbi:MAG: hypothetical protein A2622_00945 [Bdellovibrionales bacterium RIFCSPHIGHO2_01_FULL_40_29]|nr:MAG: hypothetical protein A2622_00945 [Bdellovibrionales bacterium RIFCSPHIGHO2_01_FULL_40_29]OFZ32681.1 MAG: hypothetical protein A3D17_05545 [Bdellovibrionales bacterium RIFCSPHIGHO2_02_FULL_40_15]
MYQSKILLISLFAILSLASTTQAQDVGVKVNGISTEEDTTISIKKGAGTANKKKYIISEGGEDVVGDKDVLKKNAEKNWKQACDDWKKEVKEMNKDNKVIALSCGSMSCSKEGVESTCKSNGTYKIRILEEE